MPRLKIKHKYSSKDQEILDMFDKHINTILAEYESMLSKSKRGDATSVVEYELLRMSTDIGRINAIKARSIALMLPSAVIIKNKSREDVI